MTESQFLPYHCIPDSATAKESFRLTESGLLREKEERTSRVSERSLRVASMPAKVPDASLRRSCNGNGAFELEESEIPFFSDVPALLIYQSSP